MPRPLRAHYDGAIFHITNRGVDRQPIFLSEKERTRFLKILDEALKRAGARILAYCLMPNHLHLEIQAGRTPLSVPLQEAFGRYSTYFNFIHGRTGHLFQGRYHSVLCKDVRQLVDAVTYILMNPVEAKLVPTPAGWKWSSHAELVAGVQGWTDLSALEEASGLTPDELRQLYLERIGGAESTTLETTNQLLDAISAKYGIRSEELKAGRRSGAHTNARLEFLRLSRTAGRSDAETARALGCTQSAVSQLGRKLSCA